jgi:hypothetical protein
LRDLCIPVAYTVCQHPEVTCRPHKTTYGSLEKCGE